MCNLNKGRYIASMSICKGTEIFVNRKRFKRERERERERESGERDLHWKAKHILNRRQWKYKILQMSVKVILRLHLKNIEKKIHGKQH